MPSVNDKSYVVNPRHNVAVSTEVYWIPTGEDTPRGCKLQLLGDGGVACYGIYYGEKFWTHWQSVPRRLESHKAVGGANTSIEGMQNE